MIPEVLSHDAVAQAIAWRRHLHRNPELAYQEHKTADFIADRLAESGLNVHRGLAGTGVVGTLARGEGGCTIGIRADMDALPIEERGTIAYASSTRGIMHACGHDGHMAIALAAARYCSELPDLHGTVHFIFQPAEEGHRGAAQMMEEGLFRLFPCDQIFALHNWPSLPVGTCVARDGAMMAATALLDVLVRGRGGHGAMPHESVDPIVATCAMVSAFQSIVGRNVDPQKAAVLSITQMRAGDSFNVIPAEVRLAGTARWLDPSVGDLLDTRMRDIAQSVARAYGCEADVTFERRFPPTNNEPKAAQLIRSLARSASVGLVVEDAAPSLASEDFSCMLESVPGCYLWLGTGGPHGLHSPHLDFNDAALPYGAALWIALVRDRLARGVKWE